MRSAIRSSCGGNRRKIGAIRVTLEKRMEQYERGNEFVLPMAANVIVVSETVGRFTRTACENRAIEISRLYLLTL